MCCRVERDPPIVRCAIESGSTQPLCLCVCLRATCVYLVDLSKTYASLKPQNLFSRGNFLVSFSYISKTNDRSNDRRFLLKTAEKLHGWFVLVPSVQAITMIYNST